MTEVVPLNTRFQVLTTHANTSDAVLDDMIVNIPCHQEIRVCKQHMMDTKNSDIGSCELDPTCTVVSTCSQVSNTSNLLTPVKNDKFPISVAVDNTQFPGLPKLHNQYNISLFSQPKAAESLNLIDVKANAGSVESMYSNTAIPVQI